MKALLLAILLAVAGLNAAFAEEKGPNCAKCCGDKCAECCGDKCAECKGCQ